MCQQQQCSEDQTFSYLGKRGVVDHRLLPWLQYRSPSTVRCPVSGKVTRPDGDCVAHQAVEPTTSSQLLPPQRVVSEGAAGDVDRLALGDADGAARGEGVVVVECGAVNQQAAAGAVDAHGTTLHVHAAE
jgi:hypothetical protein